MPFQLHRVLEMFSALFALEGTFICVFSWVLIVVSFIRVTVVTLTAFVHSTTMSTFMFYQITFVSEVPLWQTMWWSSWLLKGKNALQTLHSNWPSLWMYWCRVNALGVWKNFLHFLHWSLQCFCLKWSFLSLQVDHLSTHIKHLNRYGFLLFFFGLMAEPPFLRMSVFVINVFCLVFFFGLLLHPTVFLFLGTVGLVPSSNITVASLSVSWTMGVSFFGTVLACVCTLGPDIMPLLLASMYLCAANL